MLIAITDIFLSSDELIKKAVESYCKIFDKPLQAFRIVRESNKKPFLTPKIVEFSLSHSGKYKLIALSEKEVGIDIEKNNSINYKGIALRFFSANEECKSLDEFYGLWTAKESYAKRKESDIIKTLAKIVPLSEIQYLDLFEGYTVAVASEDTNIVLMFT